MPKADLFFYMLVLLMLSLFPVLEISQPEERNFVAMAAILLLGIPHGAIDNSIFLRNSKISVVRFFAVYIGVIGLNVLLWFLAPSLAYIGFIALSAYHFGQSQWEDVSQISKWLKGILFGAWGALIISTYVYFNSEELMRTMTLHPDLRQLTDFFHAGFVTFATVASFITTAFITTVLFVQRKLKVDRVLKELFIYFLVVATAYLFDFLIGFAMFFVLVHAFKVLQTEFRFFHGDGKWVEVLRFIKRLLPLTILSMAGIGMLWILVEWGALNISYPLLFLIVISSITVPHAFVMERFYQLKR